MLTYGRFVQIGFIDYFIILRGMKFASKINFGKPYSSKIYRLASSVVPNHGRGSEPMNAKIDHFLDITSEVCPMTFVRTRLLIEKMGAGEMAEIRLKGQEPLENVPESVAELGHDVLNIRPENDDTETNVHFILIRKN